MSPFHPPMCLTHVCSILGAHKARKFLEEKFGKRYDKGCFATIPAHNGNNGKEYFVGTTDGYKPSD